jgi:Concanavalin A-like lectin/glucanases superfamily
MTLGAQKKFFSAIFFAFVIGASAQTTNLSGKLLAYLPFTQNLEDASPDKLPVKIKGGVKIENDTAYFPSGKSWLELPTLPFNQPFAISVWIKTDGDEMFGLIEQRQANKGDQLFHVMLRKALQPYLGFYMNDVISPRSIKAAEWTHLIFQYTGTHQEIWVNGQLLCSRKAKPYNGSKGPTLIGKNPGWRNVPAKNFQGYMSELRIYGRALSPEEVAKLNVAPTSIELASNSQENPKTNPIQISNLTNSPTVISEPVRPFLSIEGNMLTINGASGEIYLLEATTNLASPWESLAMLTNLTGQVEFTDTDAQKFSQRFYRVEVTPHA